MMAVLMQSYLCKKNLDFEKMSKPKILKAELLELTSKLSGKNQNNK